MLLTVRNLLAATVVVVAAVASLTACQNHSRSAAADRSQPAPQPTSLTGTLQGRVAAIGGETTGWRLVGDGATGGFDVDVSRVESRAKSLDGKRVTVTGRMSTRNWPERGPTQVLVAEKIAPAPAPGTK